MSACDDLYWATITGSELEDFASTCGYRNTQTGLCVVRYSGGFNEQPGRSPPPPGSTPTKTNVPLLDGLVGTCADGDFRSCDRLSQLAPAESDVALFGDTCGGRTEAWRICGLYYR